MPKQEELPEAPWECAVILLPRGTGKLMLFQPGTNQIDALSSNLARTDLQGHVKWQAELPNPKPNNYDNYVSMKLSGWKLTASTRSGYLVTLDLKTGEIKEKVLTK